MNKIAVIGAGAWGTALAIQAVRAGNEVVLIARTRAKACAIQAAYASPRLLGIRFPPSLQVAETVPLDVKLLLWVVPTQYLRASFAHFCHSDIPVIVCAKGAEAGTNLLPLEVAAEACSPRPLAILSGPNFAREVASGLPAAATVASTNADLRDHILAVLGTANFRLYGSDDPIGVQIGGAAKNVIAIAAGAVIGAGLGENARAALVTRGLTELAQLTRALGGRSETVMGLSGLGDLLLTCTGSSSRNFSLGLAIGEGRSVEDVLARRSVVTEGVLTAASLVNRAGSVEMPICRSVAALLVGEITLEQAISQLLSRPQRDE